jgi:hypothetical protein
VRVRYKCPQTACPHAEQELMTFTVKLTFAISWKTL